MNITEKILARGASKSKLEPGEITFAKVDKVMLHDVSGPGVIKVFDKLKKEGTANVDKLFDPSKVWVAEDHFVPSAEKISPFNRTYAISVCPKPQAKEPSAPVVLV